MSTDLTRCPGCGIVKAPKGLQRGVQSALMVTLSWAAFEVDNTYLMVACWVWVLLIALAMEKVK